MNLIETIIVLNAYILKTGAHAFIIFIKVKYS